MSWQPIETAPKDREILIRLKRGDKVWVDIGEWRKDAFGGQEWLDRYGSPLVDDEDVATGWQELPAP